MTLGGPVPRTQLLLWRARAANIGGAPQLAGLGLLTGVVSAEVLKWMSSIKRDLRRRWHESGTLRCTLLLLARRALLGALSGCCR